jgi:D-alanine-D-alanine ligase-like ATP-grasp enzyme
VSAPIRIGILFGGPSAEHEVSCASALGVARALAGSGYRTVAIGVTRSGGFRLMPDSVLAELRDRPASERAIDDQLVVTGPAVELRSSHARESYR